jgi:hypothetical protein
MPSDTEDEPSDNPTARARGAVKGQSDGQWAQQQQRRLAGAFDTAKVKTEWQTQHSWLVDRGLEKDGRWRAGCDLCVTVFDSRLATARQHSLGAKHKARVAAAAAEAASRQRGLGMYGADALLRREEALIAKARKERDPATTNQMTCLLSIVSGPRLCAAVAPTPAVTLLRRVALCNAIHIFTGLCLFAVEAWPPYDGLRRSSRTAPPAPQP